MRETHYSLAPIGFLRSPLKDRGAAPNQGREGAPDAWLEVDAAMTEGLEGIEVGDEGIDALIIRPLVPTVPGGGDSG